MHCGLRNLAMLVIAALVVGAPQGGHAQTVLEALARGDALGRFSEAELRAALAELKHQGKARRPTPPLSIIGIRSGFGLSAGQVVLGAAATNRRERRPDGGFDGSLGFGLGLGETASGLGANLWAEITSVTPSQFADSGSLGFSLHRRVPALAPGGEARLALAVGRLVTWGDVRGLSSEFSVTYSSTIPARSSQVPFGGLLVSAGWGNGVRGLGRRPGALFGVAAGLGTAGSASLAWAGDEWIAGASLALGADRRTILGIGIGDLTNRLQGRRVIVTLSRGFNLTGHVALRGSGRAR